MLIELLRWDRGVATLGLHWNQKLNTDEMKSKKANIEHRTSNIEHQTSNIEHRKHQIPGKDTSQADVELELGGT
jgi:hypothetical protein